MAVKFTNNAYSTLASSITNAVTTISLAAGTGSRFPALTAGDIFYATLVDSSNNLEIVKCTARSTDTLTVVRAQDSTAARAFAAGDRIELRTVAASLTAIYDDAKAYTDTSATAAVTAHTGASTGAHAATAISFSPTGLVAATNVQTAIAEVDSEKVAKTTTITAGAGLTGGGDLSANRTLAIATTSNGYGTRTVSTSAPTGGSDGDVWYQV